jgi:centromere-localized protein 2
MPTKEASLLADFLLAPAALRTFMTLEQFSEIFPRSQQENPVIKSLYDELQRLRHEDVQEVRANIAAEIKRSRPLQREVARARRDDDHRAAGVDFVALGMEGEVLSLPLGIP